MLASALFNAASASLALSFAVFNVASNPAFSFAARSCSSLKPFAAAARASCFSASTAFNRSSKFLCAAAALSVASFNLASNSIDFLFASSSTRTFSALNC